VDLDDWELSKELYLDIRVPTYLNGVVWLKYGLHKTSRKLSNGISRLNLKEFNDTLRSGVSDGTFTIDISDTPPEIGIRDVPIFRVTKAFDIKSVDYALIRNGKDRCLQVKWVEDGFASQNRVVRLWNIEAPDSQPVAQETTEMGLCEVLIANVSHGNYRIEVDVVDVDGSWAMGASFPMESKNNTRDIVIAPTIYCKQCDYSCSTEWGMINHIKREHTNEEFINSFVKHLSYDELRKVYSLPLPERIYKCPYCGSKYFATVGDLKEHQEKNCPKVDREFGDRGKINIKFSLVSNVDEIRKQYIHDLPYVYKCTICGFYFEEFNTDKIFRHLLEKHKDEFCIIK
jgi:DNA-directed RNA polymerase subunit RPC12/RpoP